MIGTKAGDRVVIHYTGRLDDGTVFDSSSGGDPLEFTAGSNELIPGVSQAVIGMIPGDTKTVEVPPEQGYGSRNPDQVHKIEKHHLPPEAEVGMALQVQSEEVEPFTVWIAEIDEEFAILDANHPLAGQLLIFDIEMVSVTPQ